MTYAAEVLADSPLVYWRLGDAAGTTMTDSSGSGRDGTYVNTPTLGVTGALISDANTAVTWDGSTERGFIAWASWQNVSSLTVEAWVKTTQTSIRAIIDRDASGFSRAFQFRMNATGKLEFLRIANAAGTVAVATATSTSIINDGEWHHVAATYDGSTIRLYIDGVADGTAAAAGGIVQPASGTRLSVAVNDSLAANAGAAFWLGSIDEAAYYGTVLSDTRIMRHYLAGINHPLLAPYATEVLADTPAVYYRLADAAGTTATDSSGNARNATYAGTYTLNQTGLLTNDSNAAVTVNSGRASIADAAWMDFTAMTLEAIFKPTSIGTVQTILSRFLAGSNATSMFTLRVSAAGSLQLLIFFSGGSTSTITIGTIAAATRYHVQVTWDGTTLKTFLNGTLRTSQAAIFNVGVVTQAFSMGSASAAPTTEPLVGTIDEVSWTGSALSRARLQARYLSALLGPDPVAVVGATAHETEHGNTGTLTLGYTGQTGTEHEHGNAGVVTEASSWVGATATEAEQGNPGVVTTDITVEGATASEAEQALPGTLTIGYEGATAHEHEQGHPGALTVDTNWVGATAEELEQGNAGSVFEGFVVTGATAQEAEQGLPGSVTQAPGTANNYDTGRVRTGRGVPLWEPDVEPAPLPLAAHVNDIVAAKWDGYGITNTQLNLTARKEVRRPAHRYRILVAGRDLTYWRGHVTPAPQMQLVEPLLYGPATLTLPQVQVPYEQPGYGALTWMVPNAPVRIQLVDSDDDVALTVWAGRLLSPSISGTQLSWSMMGQATGPAALQDKQIPLAKRKNDLGYWWWGAINQLRLPFLPRLGPDTGIKLWNSGGSSLLNYMLDLAAKGWERNGTQWTCMPDPWETGGTYRVTRKDTTTIHATVYLDDHMVVPSLTRDPAEEPNRMFASSVSPNGRRIRFGVYPVMSDGPAPPFPGLIHPGDTGAEVTALVWRLVVVGLLSQEDRPGGYDDDVEDAVRALQKRAGLPRTGIVNNATWQALYDVGITGYDLAGSRILPADEWASVRRFDRSPNGNILRQNPDWNPDQMVVDRTVNLGPDFTRQQDLHWARRNITDPDNPRNWVGQLTFNGGGVIVGEHNFGDPLVAADIEDAAFLRPGMNVWLPTWDGGTLVHISALNLSGGPVVADVDTRARDALQVWEVQQRNRESRQNPARAFELNHRSSMMPKDAIIEWEENGGVLEDRHTYLRAGWNHFPQVVGQEGQVAWVRFHTGAKDTDPAEFCVAITAREVTDEKWDALIGDPLSAVGNKRWTNETVREALDDRFLLLYVAGNDENPCGYYPSKKVGDDGEPTGDPLTGVWEDAGSPFSYRTTGDPVVWVSIYAKHATRLRDGKILKSQGEAGS